MLDRQGAEREKDKALTLCKYCLQASKHLCVTNTVLAKKSKVSYRLLWETTSPVRRSVSDPTASFPWIYTALVLIWLGVLYIDSYLFMDISSLFVNRAYTNSSKCVLWRLFSVKTSLMLKNKKNARFWVYHHFLEGSKYSKLIWSLSLGYLMAVQAECLISTSTSRNVWD